MEVVEISISVPWGHIAGCWYGDRKLRPILALHGWNANSGTFDRLIPLLPPHIGILCIDFPGHGRSSAYPIGTNYHMIDYVSVIRLLVNICGWTKVSLLGHSLGGIVAFIYASLYPDTVDMLIQLDVVMTPKRSVDYRFIKLYLGIEKSLIASEPPTYTYEQLEEKLYIDSNKSIKKENCKYILNRCISQSQLFPDKYYFSCDERIKYCQEFNPPLDLIQKMAYRLRHLNYLVIKFKYSNYISDTMLINICHLCANLTIYEVNGLHHAHLNNPEKVAHKINPFILQHFQN